MSVNKALENILEGNLDAMRTHLSNTLATKAVEKLEERKIDIAQSYFGQVMEEVEELDERTVASKKAKKGTKWKVQSKNPDSEGSDITLRQGKRKKAVGGFYRDTQEFGLSKTKKGKMNIKDRGAWYNSAADILKTVKE